MTLRALITRVLDAHSASCLDSASERDDVADALLTAIRDSEQGELVRAALGEEPAHYVVRIASSHGKSVERLAVAAMFLAAAEDGT